MFRILLTATILFAGAGGAFAADTAVDHAAMIASVKTVKPVEGFNHEIGGQRFVGYFVARDGACAVTVMTADRDDERLAKAPTRTELLIPAADRSEIEAEGGRALGIGCTVDADAIKIVTLEPRTMRSAARP